MSMQVNSLFTAECSSVAAQWLLQVSANVLNRIEASRLSRKLPVGTANEQQVYERLHER